MPLAQLCRRFRGLAPAATRVGHRESEFLALCTFSVGRFSEGDFASGFLAFFDMEQPLRDCSDRAEIAATLLRAGRLNLCVDIIYELEKMLLALRADWLKESEIHAE
jgi:hypothetical protein